MRAPTPRPAQGFSTHRANEWIIVTAIVTALAYTFRRLVSPTQAATGGGHTAARLVGAGPPPPLEQWAVAYTGAFFGLALLAVAAPEVAATLALMMAVGELIANGTAIASELQGLQGAQPAGVISVHPATPVPAPTPQGGFRP